MNLTHTSKLKNFQETHVIKKQVVISLTVNFLFLITYLTVKAIRLKFSPDVILRQRLILP